MNCYRCGASLAALSLPIGRLEECPECSIQLHVCRMCVFFDPAVPRQCREDDADEVKLQNKDRANFCDYYKPSENNFDGSFTVAETRAKKDLNSLFDDGNDDEESRGGDDSLDDAENLFK
jgi:hypothetical protein